MMRLTVRAARRLIGRFALEINNGASLEGATDALINSPNKKVGELTERMLCCTKVRHEVVSILNGGTPPSQRCYPARESDVKLLIQTPRRTDGQLAKRWYSSPRAGMWEPFTLETVWIAACNVFGLTMPQLKNKSQGGTQKTSAGDSVVVRGMTHINDSPNYANYKPYDMCSDLTFTSQLMNRLRQMVTIHQKRKFKRDRDDGYLDEDKLVDIVRGTNLDTVREFPTDGRRVNAAVQMLIDCSGSMGSDGDRQETACALGLALGISLERLKVPLSIIGFDSSPVLVKDWDDKIRGTKIDRLEGGGGTDLPLAMEQGLPSLMERREKRKIQVVLCDGDISDGHSWWKKIKEHRLRKGYECYGFGIHVNLEDGCFDGTVNGLRQDDMIRVVSREVGKILIRN